MGAGGGVGHRGQAGGMSGWEMARSAPSPSGAGGERRVEPLERRRRGLRRPTDEDRAGLGVGPLLSTVLSAPLYTDWVLNSLLIPVAVGVTMYEAHGVVAGLVGGLLGVGGGFIIGPLFLELGIPPQVSSATATFSMMFSSSMSVVEFYLLHRFPVPYGLPSSSSAFLYALAHIGSAAACLLLGFLDHRRRALFPVPTLPLCPTPRSTSTFPSSAPSSCSLSASFLAPATTATSLSPPRMPGVALGLHPCGPVAREDLAGAGVLAAACMQGGDGPRW
ncbi:hypothetical protein HU200_000627 [Digitaria exilis]|uniref:Sulfite exporter TauE/SafE family protein n=1 Tax=Digitaria exilis TaxID=1010633 RepID=A0A835FYJ5_9POAL|nr:hypothetical protein HU200_000627 [Digitaria exilis]